MTHAGPESLLIDRIARAKSAINRVGRKIALSIPEDDTKGGKEPQVRDYDTMEDLSEHEIDQEETGTIVRRSEGDPESSEVKPSWLEHDNIPLVLSSYFFSFVTIVIV